MCNKLFPKDDPFALAYIAAQLSAAGYEDEAWLIKHQPESAEMIYKLVNHFSERGGQAIAEAWKNIRQLPSALPKWWHEHLQPYTKFGDERVKHPLVDLRERKGSGYGTTIRHSNRET